MGYVHCHNCDWQQDDFWDFSFAKHGYFWGWRYNPFSLFLSYLFGGPGAYWKPAIHEVDMWFARERGWKSNRRFSWLLAWDEFRRMLRALWRQKWWTHSSWEKAKARNDGEWPCCPACGHRSLDID